MRKKQGGTARKSTMCMLVSGILVLSAIGGFIYFQAITHVATLMLFELQNLHISEQVRSIPVPSAILLFSMGFLGIVCVRLAENKRESNSSRLKNLKKVTN